MIAQRDVLRMAWRIGARAAADSLDAGRMAGLDRGPRDEGYSIELLADQTAAAAGAPELAEECAWVMRRAGEVAREPGPAEAEAAWRTRRARCTLKAKRDAMRGVLTAGSFQPKIGGRIHAARIERWIERRRPGLSYGWVRAEIETACGRTFEGLGGNVWDAARHPPTCAACKRKAVKP